MKVAVVAAEMAPYAKAGGLADVIGALPMELAACGGRVCVVMPGYKSALAALPTETIGDEYSVMVGRQRERFRVRTGVGAGGVPIFFIVHDGYFGRDGIYGEDGHDYPDAIYRYIFFGRAAARMLGDFIKPDAVHAHDWHTALLPILMRADPALRAPFERTASLFTIHNVAFQGLCDASQFPLLNLDRSYLSVEYLEFYGRVNLMKGAVVLANAASTVSPTYAREVSSDPSFGFGLEGVLRAKGSRFVGILNGADYREWNPATDQHIAARYTPEDARGKVLCAAALRKRTGLAALSKRALVGMVSRMTAQKGFDLLVPALDQLMALEIDLVVLGNGEPQFEAGMRAAQRAYPERIAVSTAFDNDLAHQIQAGCDLFLMPSRFEPCGLTQMYALKYGAAPVVRATGGLADTVAEFDPATGSGNGFVFERYEAAELIAAMRRALRVFGDPAAWRRLMANCFAADFSWSAAAARYMELYRQLVAEQAARPR
ncbi:MAG TPA: glycogen synthase GlgA [Candidatus Binataceae bacterium]